MNFNSDLSAFQGVLISVDNVHSFSKISAKGGNETKIDYIIVKILNFLLEKKYISEGSLEQNTIPILRRFAFYIVLNAELPVLETMLEMEGMDSVIWTVPTISKCLMSELFWTLDMDTFLYEIIVYSSPALSLEVADAFIENLKYFKPSESIPKLKLLCSALYRFMCRMHFFSFDDNLLTSTLNRANNSFAKCVNYFVDPPNAERLNSMHKNTLYRYKGDCLLKMLQLIHECFDYFVTKEVFSREGFDNIYMLTIKAGVVRNNVLGFAYCDSPNQIILNELNKAHQKVLDKCQQLVMDVSVDVFCSWFEFEEEEKNMQQWIGELCYELRLKLSHLSSLSEHPLVNMLHQISLEPIDLKDVINDTDTSTIITKINENSEAKNEWIRALVHKNNVCNDMTLVKILDAHLPILHKDDCCKLYQMLDQHIRQNNLNDEEFFKVMAVKTFERCNNTNKLELLMEEFADNRFTDRMETTHLGNMMTEIFNKIISSDADFTNILCLFLQSPEKVFNKIFSLAAENAHQCEIMLKVINILKNFSNHFYEYDTEPCVIKVTRIYFENGFSSEDKQIYFISYVTGLKTSGIIPGLKLLLLIIMPNLHKSLLTKDINGINNQIKLLQKAYTINELLEYRAPVLAMLAQVLDVVRWRLNTFTSIAPPTLNLSLQIQETFMDSYNNKIPDNEANWLRSKLKNVNIMNLYYYRKLLNGISENFGEALSGRKIQTNMNIEQLTLWVSQTICSCTQEEWSEMWDSLSCVLGDKPVLNILHNAMSIILVSDAANRTDNSWSCLLYCYRNFTYTIRYKYFKEPLTNKQVEAVILRMAAILNSVDETRRVQMETVLLPLLAFIVEKKNQYTTNVPIFLRSKLKYSTFSESMNKLFSN